jgi:ketosteroid isomerase-like protein
MNEQQNIQKISDVYAAFSRGDIGFILDQVTDDVRWLSHFDESVPWAGDYSGKNRVPAFFQGISESVEVTGFEPGEYIAQGDNVVSLGYFACKSLATGKSARTKWIFVWKLRDGKIYSYEQFHEPAIAEIFRGVPATV